MTYNPDLNCLVVCACETDYYTEIYLVDLETLTIKNTVDLSTLDSETWPSKEHGINGIAYNQNKKQYAVTTDGNDHIYILDENFKIVTKYATTGLTRPIEIPTAIGSQGIYCDDNFIYCLLYDSDNKLSTNITVTQVHGISVFDWDGNRVKEIKFSVLPNDLPETIDGMTILKNEPENITFVNGKFYMGVNVAPKVNNELYQAQLLCTLEIVTN